MVDLDLHTHHRLLDFVEIQDGDRIRRDDDAQRLDDREAARFQNKNITAVFSFSDLSCHALIPRARCFAVTLGNNYLYLGS